MSLKGDRQELFVSIDFFGNSVMTRGGVVSYQTLGSGQALDQSAALVQYAANSSGAYPVGILLNDMVNIDLTRQHINWLRDETIIGGKVAIGRKGWWLTNNLVQGPSAIAKGDLAVLTSSGSIMNLPATYADGSNPTAWNRQVNPLVGKFWSTLDEDGYAKVSPDL